MDEMVHYRYGYLQHIRDIFLVDFELKIPNKNENQTLGIFLLSLFSSLRTFSPNCKSKYDSLFDYSMLDELIKKENCHTN